MMSNENRFLKSEEKDNKLKVVANCLFELVFYFMFSQICFTIITSILEETGALSELS